MSESVRYLPNEATTEYMAFCAIEETAGIKAFMEGLSDEQRRRFEEISHHLVHIGFEGGSTRRNIQPTEAAMGKILVAETSLVLNATEKITKDISELRAQSYLKGLFDGLGILEDGGNLHGFTS
jgi:hypothetical protein